MNTQNTFNSNEHNQALFLGRISPAFPIIGFCLLLVFLIFRHAHNEWYGLGVGLVGGGLFALLSIIGGALGLYAQSKQQTTLSGSLSIVIGFIMLLLMLMVISQ
jgi:lipopolysaccharide export LptBFGC system permease protein LptF